MSVIMDFDDGRIWHKSSRSGGDQGGCVCVTTSEPTGKIGVRDSKQGPTGSSLWCHPTAWTTFLNIVK